MTDLRALINRVDDPVAQKALMALAGRLDRLERAVCKCPPPPAVHDNALPHRSPCPLVEGPV